jgi:hypothetical protein
MNLKSAWSASPEHYKTPNQTFNGQAQRITLVLLDVAQANSTTNCTRSVKCAFAQTHPIAPSGVNLGLNSSATNPMVSINTIVQWTIRNASGLIASVN